MPNNDETLQAIQRMNKLLALVAVKGLEDKDAVLMLTRAGFTQAEVANLLDKGLSAVSMIVSRHKGKQEAEKAARRKGSKTAAEATASNGDGE